MGFALKNVPSVARIVPTRPCIERCSLSKCAVESLLFFIDCHFGGFFLSSFFLGWGLTASVFGIGKRRIFGLEQKKLGVALNSRGDPNTFSTINA